MAERNDLPDHLPEELDRLIIIGNRMVRDLDDRTSPFAQMMTRAQGEYVLAARALIDVDLMTGAGIAEARRLQAQARRYQDLCVWISNCLEEAGQAEDEDAEFDEHDEPAIEEMKEMMHGRRDKPATDA